MEYQNHKPAHELRAIGEEFNKEYGAREVERLGLFEDLEKCAKHGQLGYRFTKIISGIGIRYLESLGYKVTRRDGNRAFYVDFSEAIIPGEDK